jgi:hypothetical protein
MRVVKARTRVTEGLSNGALVLDHAARVGEAVRVDLGLPKGLECVNAHVRSPYSHLGIFRLNLLSISYLC